MKHGKKNFLKNKWAFGLLLAAAIGVLAFSGVQTSRAVLTTFSSNYAAALSVSDIGITLVENGQKISWRDYTGSGDKWDENTGALLGGMLGDESVQPGRSYPEALAVSNTGSIDEYVRVILYRYWEGPDGKDTDLSPTLIDLHLLGNGWVVDESVSTQERIVLYYTRPLAVGETTPPLSDLLTISGTLADHVTTTETKDENGFTTIHRTFDYNGVRFMIEAEADGVQTHNAEEAVKSAWGIDVTVAADGSLSLG